MSNIYRSCNSCTSRNCSNNEVDPKLMIEKQLYEDIDENKISQQKQLNDFKKMI